MFCKNCGKKIEESNAEYCDYCINIKNSDESNKNEESIKEKKLPSIKSLFTKRSVMFDIIFIFIFMFDNNPSKLSVIFGIIWFIINILIIFLTCIHHIILILKNIHKKKE